MPILLRDGVQDSTPVAGPVISFGPEGHPPPHGLASAYGATLCSPEVLQAAVDMDAADAALIDSTESPEAWGTSPLARVKPAALAAAYGATLIGSNGLRTAIEARTPLTPAYWRNGAWLDMANVVEMLRDRGLAVDYNPEHPAKRDATVYASIDSATTMILRVSHDEQRPYTLLIIKADDTAILPGRTTTAAGVIQILDAFLAGLKLGTSRAG